MKNFWATAKLTIFSVMLFINIIIVGILFLSSEDVVIYDCEEVLTDPRFSNDLKNECRRLFLEELMKLKEKDKLIV